MINGANSSAKSALLLLSVLITLNPVNECSAHTHLMMDSKVLGLQNEDGSVSKAGHELIMRLT